MVLEHCIEISNELAIFRLYDVLTKPNSQLS
jgi:hypothetical protein